jgi:hypothetical protein
VPTDDQTIHQGQDDCVPSMETYVTASADVLAICKEENS